MTTITCIRCGGTREVSDRYAAFTKYCLECHKPKVLADDKDFSRDDFEVEILATTEQFNKGARFSKTELEYMLNLGTIIPDTTLSVKGDRFIVKYASSTNPETKLQRTKLCPV